MVTGFQISAVILATAVVIAFTLIPKRMRETQAEVEDVEQVKTAHGIDPHPEPAAA